MQILLLTLPTTPPLTPTPTVTPQNVDVSGLHLEEGDTTTTVAIGQDTYTIGKKS